MTIGRGVSLALEAIGSTAWHAWVGTLPEAEDMGTGGIPALIAHLALKLVMADRLRQPP